MIVLDSNVFAKMLVRENDSETARALIHSIQSAVTPVVLPSLFTYEVIQIGRYHDLEASVVLDFLESQLLRNWAVLEPTREHWKIAQRISLTGNEKSGYPAMYDSIYHALAIAQQGQFITADRKHFSKAHAFGHIVLLENWNDHLGDIAG